MVSESPRADGRGPAEVSARPALQVPGGRSHIGTIWRLDVLGGRTRYLRSNVEQHCFIGILFCVLFIYLFKVSPIMICIRC